MDLTKLKSILNPIRYTPLIILMLLAISSLTTKIGMSGIRDRQEIRANLYQLKSDILNANIALRNAGIAVTAYDASKELDKMLVTRSSANQVLDFLTAAKLSHRERTLVNEMKKERPEYREAQLKVVDFIKKQQKPEAWSALHYYQTLMDRYVQRVDTLLALSKERETEIFADTRQLSILLLVFSFAIVVYMFWRVK